MGYLGNLARAMIGRPQATTFDLSAMTPEMMREFLRVGGSFESASGMTVNDNTAMRVAVAWRCTNIIAGTAGSLPLDLIRRTSETTREPAKGHPLRRVLTVKPNQWQTPSEFRRMLQAHLLLRGNAYALIVRLGRNVVGLVPLHPDKVQVKQLDDMTMEYTVGLQGGRSKVYGARDIFHLRGLSLDGVKGLSVLSHMRESIGLALSAEHAAASVMRNGQFVSGAVKHPNKLSPEAYQRLKASLEDRYSGASNAGKIMVLEEGLEPVLVGMTSKDMQFLEMRDFERYDICMFYGVPPHMAGLTEKTTSWGSGIEQMGIGFVTYTLNDWLRIWEEGIKRSLIDESEWDTLDVRFYTQGLMRGDVNTRWNSYTRALQWGVMSPNEVRGLEDMNGRDGGDIYYPPPNTAGSPTMTDPGAPQNEPAPPADA